MGGKVVCDFGGMEQVARFRNVGRDYSRRNGIPEFGIVCTFGWSVMAPNGRTIEIPLLGGVKALHQVECRNGLRACAKRWLEEFVRNAGGE